MAHITYELQELYNKTFGSRPTVPAEKDSAQPSPFQVNGSNPNSFTNTGNSLTADYKGKEIWLPIKFFDLDASIFGTSELLLPYTVIKVSSKKNIVKTPMSERQGTVKELYNIEDVSIRIKGFIIGYDKSGKYPVWPEEDLRTLKSLFDLNESVKLDNALSNIFIGSEHRVVIESLELPEVTGGKKHVRPFSMSLESDTIFELSLDGLPVTNVSRTQSQIQVFSVQSQTQTQ